MAVDPKQTILCEVCHNPKKAGEVFPLCMVHEPILGLIQKDHPGLSPTGYICLDHLNQYRMAFISQALKEEKGELSELEEEVIRSLKEQETVSKDVNAEFQGRLRFGDRLSDRISLFGGSWKFIIAFGLTLLLWITLNSAALFKKPFDPFPFILLNLVLSCLAAIQAPVILMSQNREESKDRLRSEFDYRVNLKAELEIRHIHQKLDHFFNKQWQTLMEVQKIQIELMNELMGLKSGRPEEKEE